MKYKVISHNFVVPYGTILEENSEYLGGESSILIHLENNLIEVVEVEKPVKASKKTTEESKSETKE